MQSSNKKLQQVLQNIGVIKLSECLVGMIWRRMEKGERKIGWTLGDCLFGWGQKLDKILVDFRFCFFFL